MRLEYGLRLAPYWSSIRKMTMTSRFPVKSSSPKFFDVAVFLLSCLVTGPSFMSIWSLVPELWQFSFIKDWPKNQKLEIPPSEFCSISGDKNELGIRNWPNVSKELLLNAAKCHSYSCYCFWVIKGHLPRVFASPPRLGLNKRRWCSHYVNFKHCFFRPDNLQKHQ